MEMSVNDNITTMYNLQQARKSSPSEVNPSKSTDGFKNDKSATNMKLGVGICSAVGVAAALAVLSKFDRHHKYTLNPRKIFNGSLKNCYLMKAKYKTKEIVGMGIGSVLGGLVGGSIFDDKSNMNSKFREAVVQIVNVSLPIAFVETMTNVGKFISKKTMPNWAKSTDVIKSTVSKLPACAGALSGLFAGIYIGNRLSNKANEKTFHVKDDRPVKMTDFSAHVDDICVAATFVAEKNPIVNIVSRLIPAALVVPGFETGTKKECH